MDRPLVKSLEAFEDASLNSLSLSMPAIPGKSSAPTVLRAGFELFHEPPGSFISDGEADNISVYQLGIAEGERRVSELHAATIAAMQTSLMHLQTSFAESLQNIQTQNAEAVSKVLGAIFPALANHSFTADFNNIFQKLLASELTGQIMICASELDLPQIEALLAGSPHSEAFTLISKDTPSGTLNLKWDNGGAIIDYAETAENAKQLLAQHFGPPIDIDTNMTEMSKI